MKRTSRITALLAAFAAACLAAPALPQPATTRPAAAQPSPFGMDALKPIFGKDLPELWTVEDTLANYLVDLGVRWDRAQITWNDVQATPGGPFDWTFTDRMVKVYHERPISAYCLLMGNGPGNTAPPATDEQRAAFASFVSQVVSRYKGTFRVWELWNEENIPSFWKDPNPRDYALLLKATYQAAKRADPGCTIILGGTSTVDIGYIKRVLYDYGGWDYCDAVAIHPYDMGGNPATQGLPELIRMTRAAATRNGVSKPVWITEVGWTTNVTQQSEYRQAENIDQEYALALSEGVRKVFLFTLGDWAEKWGIVAGKNNRPDWGFTSTFRTKPGYYALKHLIERLSPTGQRPGYLGYLPGMGDVSALAFLTDGKPSSPVLILWAPYGATTTVKLPQAAGLHALDAHDRIIPIENGRIQVTHIPILINGFRPGALKAASPKFDPSIRHPGMNLTPNPSMEIAEGDAPAFWAKGRFPEGSTSATLEWARQGHTGGRSLGITAGVDGAWRSIPIPVWEGKTYTLHAWVKPQAATGANQAAIVWYSGNMWTWLGQTVSTNATGTSDWVEITATGKAPKDAVFARLILSSKDDTGSVLWDDVALTEG